MSKAKVLVDKFFVQPDQIIYIRATPTSMVKLQTTYIVATTRHSRTNDLIMSKAL